MKIKNQYKHSAPCYNLHALLTQEDHDAIDRELRKTTKVHETPQKIEKVKRRESRAQRRELMFCITEEDDVGPAEAFRSPARSIITSRVRPPKAAHTSKMLVLPLYAANSDTSTCSSDSDGSQSRVCNISP